MVCLLNLDLPAFHKALNIVVHPLSSYVYQKTNSCEITPTGQGFPNFEGHQSVEEWWRIFKITLLELIHISQSFILFLLVICVLEFGVRIQWGGVYLQITVKGNMGAKDLEIIYFFQVCCFILF